MENLRKLFNKADRLEAAANVSNLYTYIYPLLFRRQKGACAICGQIDIRFEIDHIAYNPAVTLGELQLLCELCHAEKTYRETKSGFAKGKLNKLQLSL